MISAWGLFLFAAKHSLAQRYGWVPLTPGQIDVAKRYLPEVLARYARCRLRDFGTPQSCCPLEEIIRKPDSDLNCELDSRPPPPTQAQPQPTSLVISLMATLARSNLPPRRARLERPVAPALSVAFLWAVLLVLLARRWKNRKRASKSALTKVLEKGKVLSSRTLHMSGFKYDFSVFRQESVISVQHLYSEAKKYWCTNPQRQQFCVAQEWQLDRARVVGIKEIGTQ